jgi:hypothetical protein
MNLDDTIREIIREEINKYFYLDNNNLFKKIVDMEFKVKTINLLTQCCNLIFLGDLVCNEKLNYQRGNLYYWTVFLSEPNFGKKSYRELIDVLKSYGYDKTINNEGYWIKRKKLTYADPEFSLFKTRGYDYGNG